VLTSKIGGVSYCANASFSDALFKSGKRIVASKSRRMENFSFGQCNTIRRTTSLKRQTCRYPQAIVYLFFPGLLPALSAAVRLPCSNGGELVRGQNLRVRWQGFDLVEVRAKRVENGRTGREKRVGPTGFRHGDRPSNRELASPRVAPYRSPECHCGELQTPSSSPRRARHWRRRPEQNRSAERDRNPTGFR
jgi:hypothetical protein